jgi:hypothetical protein
MESEIGLVQNGVDPDVAGAAAIELSEEAQIASLPEQPVRVVAAPRSAAQYDASEAQRQKEAILEQQRRLQAMRADAPQRSAEDIKMDHQMQDFIADVQAQLESQLQPLKVQAQKYATMLQSPALNVMQRHQIETYRAKLAKQAQQLKLAAQARVTQFQQQQQMLRKQQQQQQQLREQLESFKKWQEEQLEAGRRKVATLSSSSNASLSISIPPERSTASSTTTVTKKESEW